MNGNTGIARGEIIDLWICFFLDGCYDDVASFCPGCFQQ